jgi:hypothetical protein
MHEGLWYAGWFYITKIHDHINLGVNVKGLLPEETKMLLGTGKTMRHLKFFPDQPIDDRKVLTRLKIVWDKAICDEQIRWHLDKKKKSPSRRSGD